MSSPFQTMIDLIKGRLDIFDLTAVSVAFSMGFLAKNSTSQKPAPIKPVSVDHFGFCQGRIAKKPKPDDIECPYEYLLRLYGRHHFEPFVHEFQPTLEAEDPAKFALILDIMDAVHFALILVDDISDNSLQRKAKPAAHTIYGASETANRAYLVLTTVINRALRERPVLGVELMKALEKILKGQDLSLVWRRDGLESFPYQGEDRIAAYKNMASLKTGTLFVLLGRLLNDGGEQLDDLMTRFGWYAQLQNDCKNIYSKEYVTSKGGVAEDLRNGELSLPIIVALNEEHGGPIMERALESHADKDIEAALDALQADQVRATCLKALKEAGRGLDKYVGLWGRREKLASSG